MRSRSHDFLGQATHAVERPATIPGTATAMPDYRHLLFERSDDRHVVTVTLNRPEQHNAMNTAMGEDLLACFTALASDPDVRVVILTGGGDHGLLRRRRSQGARGDDRRGVARPARDLRAGGAAACCAVRCRSSPRWRASRWPAAASWRSCPTSSWPARPRSSRVPEVTLGIFPGIGGTQLLPRILGAPLAKELIFTGRRVEAREAQGRRAS